MSIPGYGKVDFILECHLDVRPGQFTRRISVSANPTVVISYLFIGFLDTGVEFNDIRILYSKGNDFYVQKEISKSHTLGPN